MNFPGNAGFDLKKLEKNIGMLLWEKPKGASVLRIKAILTAENDDFAYSLQA